VIVVVEDQVVENKGKCPPDVGGQSEGPTIRRFFVINVDISPVETEGTGERTLFGRDSGRKPGHKDPIKRFRVKIGGSKALRPPTVSVIFVFHGS
jgi:hypothetical protein